MPVSSSQESESGVLESQITRQRDCNSCTMIWLWARDMVASLHESCECEQAGDTALHGACEMGHKDIVAM